MTPDPEILRLQQVAATAVRAALDLQSQLDAAALREEEKDALARTHLAVINKLTAIVMLIDHMAAKAQRGGGGG